MLKTQKTLFEENKSPCGHAEDTGGVFEESKSPCGHAEDTGGVVEENKAPADMLEALPCLTNVHFVCLIHTLPARYAFLYTQCTFLNTQYTF